MLLDPLSTSERNTVCLPAAARAKEAEFGSSMGDNPLQSLTALRQPKRLLRIVPRRWAFRFNLAPLAIAVCLFGGQVRSLANEQSIELLPATFRLTGAQARQQVLIERVENARYVGEHAQPASYTSSNPAVASVDATGLVQPLANGDATITAVVEGASAVAAVTVSGMEQETDPSFRNDVQPVLAKMGCNTGACHGALAGKGGFKLSLRGYDPLADFDAITRSARGRRIERSSPGHSLFLLKPTMTVPHKGGLRFDVDSPAYAMISKWIAAGARPPSEDDPRVERLVVFPHDVTLRPGDEQRLIVHALYSNGSVRDVTQWSKFAATNEAMATVNDAGRIKVVGHGSGAVTVWYASKIVNVLIHSPYAMEVPDTVYAEAARHNFIDDHVLEQLQLLHLRPAALCDDGTFLRRAYLDTIGKLPTADEVRRFLDDPASDKRSRLIDGLLAREEFVDYWSYQWSDLLLVNGTRLRPEAVKAFYAWIRKSVESNLPWDQFARDIILARGTSFEHGATNFYALHQDAETMTENLSQAFLGLSIGCAKCHNHPLEKWTNDQYYAMANLLARVRGKGWGGEPRNGDGARTLFIASRGDLIQPATGKILPPAPLDSAPLPPEEDILDRRREYLANWVTSPDNPYFARAIVNRVWANYFHVGLVEPIDDLRLSNPASNEQLLAVLSKFLVENSFDLKALIRVILQSATYQRKSTPATEEVNDTRHFAHYYPRRLMAEVSLDAISQVTGVPTEFKEIEFPGADVEKTEFYAKGTRSIELYDASVVSPFLRTFGRPQRLITCQCERSNEPTLVQALHLANGATILEKLASHECRIESQWKSGLPLYRIIEDLYLSALTRYPTDNEITEILAVLNEADAGDRRKALEDVYWAVLSSREFLFNH